MLDYTQKDITNNIAKSFAYTFKQKHGSNIYRMAPSTVSSMLYNEIKAEIEQKKKKGKDKGENKTRFNELLPYHIAMAIIAHREVRMIVSDTGDQQDDHGNQQEKKKSGLLAIYDPGEGIYIVDPDAIIAIISLYCADKRTIIYKEVYEQMAVFCFGHQDFCVTENEDPDLICVNNGIFDYRTKQLYPHTPHMVYTSKIKTNYNNDFWQRGCPAYYYPDGSGEIWDVESWIAGLSEDREVVGTIWMIIGACVRSRVPWDKVALLMGSKGRNGKGTLCALIRNMIGNGMCVTMPFTSFGKEFFLSDLIGKYLIITDENDVGQQLEFAGNFKAVVSGDPVTFNIKYGKPATMRFRMFQIQCCNDLPRAKDKSESLYRRFLCVPFEAHFDDSSEKKTIKNLFIKQQDVLEYVLWRVLNMPYYDTIPEPEACKRLKNEVKINNNPVLAFWMEFRGRYVWDVLPFEFLYDHFASWYKETYQGGRCIGRNTFVRDLCGQIDGSDNWIVPTKDNDGHYRQTKVGCAMAKPEYLILKYDLKKWMNTGYNGPEIEKICTTTAPKRTRGLIRKGIQIGE